MRRACLPVLGLLLAPGCTSLWQQRDYQEVVWADGDRSRLEVWVRQGTTWVGQPWFFVLDTLGTPVVWLAEVTFAIRAMRKPDVAIAGGPLGFLASLLPGITCVPLDYRTHGLDLMDPLHLSAAARQQLFSLGGTEAVEWLARCCEALGEPGRTRAAQVRRWVVEVRLAEPAAAPTPVMPTDG